MVALWFLKSKLAKNVPNVQSFHFWGEGGLKQHFDFWSPMWHESSKSVKFSLLVRGGGTGKVAFWFVSPTFLQTFNSTWNSLLVHGQHRVLHSCLSKRLIRKPTYTLVFGIYLSVSNSFTVLLIYELYCTWIIIMFVLDGKLTFSFLFLLIFFEN